jgi:DNA-binding transcriptional LysR family regulator
MLDVRRLMIFREVAEHGSFSSAALELGYAQSVVSHHVAQLERELGLTLFERRRRPIRLTPAGERLRDHANTVLGAAAAAEDDMRALAGLEIGLLRVGAFLSACATFVPRAIGEFEARHPNVELRLHQEEPPVALPRLIAGELDLAIVFHEQDEPSASDPRLERVSLANDVYRVVVHPQHRLARRGEVSFAGLRSERFIGPRPQGAGLKYRAMLERRCANEGFVPDFAYTVDDVTVARTFVAAGLAVAVMPEMTIRHPRPDVAVKRIRGVEPFRTIDVHWLRGRHVASVAPMVALLREAAT